MDTKIIKSKFPIFKNKINGKQLVYLDNANSSQKPQALIDRITKFYSKEFSNIGRSVHSLAVTATNRFEETRDLIKNYINAKLREEIIFTKNATEAINLVASTYGDKFINKGDEILITELEHHANYVPWHFLREKKGAIIKFAECNSNGEVEIDEIKKLISNKTKMIAVTHLSNVTGAIMPIKKIVDLAKEKKIPVLIDGCQGAPHMKLDMQDLGCDFYAITGHKLCGPSGSGAIYVKKERMAEMRPFIGGGDMIREVHKGSVIYNEPPHLFEAGTPGIVQTIGLGVALDYMMSLDMDRIAAYEAGIAEYASKELKALNWLKVQGDAADKGAIFSFTIDGAGHPHDISTILDKKGIAVRAGQHCAGPLMDHLGINASCRASFAFYNTKDEVDALVDGLRLANDLLG